MIIYSHNVVTQIGKSIPKNTKVYDIACKLVIGTKCTVTIPLCGKIALFVGQLPIQVYSRTDTIISVRFSLRKMGLILVVLSGTSLMHAWN